MHTLYSDPGSFINRNDNCNLWCWLSVEPVANRNSLPLYMIGLDNPCV